MACSVAPRDRRPPQALFDVYTQMGDSAAVADALDRMIDLAEGDDERADLLFRRAEVCLRSLGQERALPQRRLVERDVGAVHLPRREVAVDRLEGA